MESDINEKNLSKFKKWRKKVKRKFREIAFKPEYLDVLEERDKMPLKEKIRTEPGLYVSLVFIIIFYIVLLTTLVICGINEYNKEPDRTDTSTYLEKQVTGTTAEFVAGDNISEYLIDGQGNTVKIAMSTIGENVAYSLRYNFDIPEDGQMTTSSYFTQGYITTIMANGYPYVDYEELGLESEEEAYIATQLAIYEIVEKEEYSMAQGGFSLDQITALDEEHKDAVERILAVSNYLVSYAYENPYEDESSVLIDSQDATLSISDATALAGPYTVTTSMDSSTIKVKGDITDELTHTIELYDYIEGTTSIIVDENGNELNEVKNSTSFYIKTAGTEKIFTQIKVSAQTYYLSSNIYKMQGDSSRYVVLEAEEVSYMDIYAIARNVTHGSVKINFGSDSEENITTIAYYIYDEDGNQVQQIDWDAYYMEFNFPTGTYYVVPYYIPDGYFLEQERYEFEIVEGECTNLQIDVDSL